MEVLQHAQRVLVNAEDTMADLCNSLDGGDAVACWDAMEYLKQKHAEAHEGCLAELRGADEWTSGMPGPCCQRLENLEKLVYELSCSGTSANLLRAMRVDKAVQEKRRTREGPVPVVEPPSAAYKLQAEEIFQRADTNGNGVIDREEMVAALKMMERNLDDEELGACLQAVSSHGFISKEDFIEICTAEAFMDPNSDAELLRKLRHEKPSWWSGNESMAWIK